MAPELFSLFGNKKINSLTSVISYVISLIVNWQRYWP